MLEYLDDKARSFAEVIYLRFFSMAFQGDSIFWVEVEKIVPNPFQPRREFDEHKLKELSESVRMYGILQPLTVTRKEIQREDGTFYTEYELIAGERRLRASKLAGLTQVPVIIRDGEDTEQEKLELAIIENLQREDLNAVDRALAFRQLADVFGLSHTDVAKKVGRSREYVSNTIRLLALPDYMLSSLKLGEMTEGHARTLLMLNDRPEEQDVVFREILMKKLSVREVERIVRKIATDKVRKKNPEEFDAELIEMEKKFMETLGTRVQIQKTDYGGRVTIDYFSVEDLEAMLHKMKSEQAALAAGGAATASASALLTEHTPLMVEEALDDTGLETALVSDQVILGEAEPPVVPLQSFEAPLEETVQDAPVTLDELREVVESNLPQAEETALADNNYYPSEPEPEVVQYEAPAYPSYHTPRYSVPEYTAPTFAGREVVEEVPPPAFVPDVFPGDPTSGEVVHMPSPEEVVEHVEKNDNDESGLYSIRNFGV